MEEERRRRQVTTALGPVLASNELITEGQTSNTRRLKSGKVDVKTLALHSSL